jgi:hypothetical protein
MGPQEGLFRQKRDMETLATMFWFRGLRLDTDHYVKECQLRLASREYTPHLHFQDILQRSSL